MPLGDYGECRSCRKLVRWAISASTGNRMPLEHDPENGNAVIDAYGKVHVLKNHAVALAAMENDAIGLGETYIAHHAKCPDRGKWSKTPRAGTAPPEFVQDALL